jgi:hypothetical protein
VFARQALVMCVIAGGGLPDSDRHGALCDAIHAEQEQDPDALPPRVRSVTPT